MESNNNEQLPGWTGVVVFITALLLFIAGVVLSFFHQPAEATTTYGAAVICLIFVFLINFESFEGFGIKAKLRKLDKKINEAERITQQMRKIALSLARTLVSDVARSGRIGSMMPRRERSERINEIQSALSEAGALTEEIEAVKKDWHWYNIFDMMEPVFASVVEFLNQKDRGVNKKLADITAPHQKPRFGNDPELLQLYEELKLNGESKHTFKELQQSPRQWDIVNKFEELLQKTVSLTSDEKDGLLEKNKETLEDVRYYSNNKIFRREEEWFIKDDGRIKE